MYNQAQGSAVKLFFLFTAIAFGVSAADITGTWKAVFVKDVPKTVPEVILHFSADGERLRGSAHVGALGDAPLVDGKVVGDLISFTVCPNVPWRNRYASGEESGGLPKLIFVGKAHGSEIEFTLVFDSITLYGKPPVAKEFLLKASQTAESRTQ